MQFNGRYTDIILNTETPVAITLLPDRMLIQIPAANQSYEWFYGMIRKKSQRGGKIILHYKDAMKGRLVISDPQFMYEVKQIAPYASFTQPVAWHQSKNGLYSMIAVKIGTIVMAVLLFIFAFPLLINFTVDRISRQTEAGLGNRIESMIINPLDEDTLQTRLVNNFFSNLSSPGDSGIHIMVLNSKIKNAFTLPGGSIVIENGIFSSMENSSELGALIGHECGHAVNRDPLKMLCRQSATSVLLLTLIGNMNGVINQILSNASYLKNLSYSREYETVADHFDYEWMKKNQVDPQGIIDLLSHLEKEDQTSMNVEFISNHPTLENRIKDVQEWMKKDGSVEYQPNPELEKIWQAIKISAPPEHSH